MEDGMNHVIENKIFRFHFNSIGIPNHPYNRSSVISHIYKESIPHIEINGMSKSYSKADLYKTKTLGEGPIGFSLNGVPFHSALDRDNVEVVQGQHADKHDECMGYIGNEGNYMYRTVPPCLFSDTDKKGQGRREKYFEHRNEPPLKYDAFTFQNAFGYYINDYELYWTTKVAGAPFVIGYAIDGYPIYSPFDEDGKEHEGLDICNGKFSNGQYAYYSTLYFPYTLGCFGPTASSINSSTPSQSKKKSRYVAYNMNTSSQ